MTTPEFRVGERVRVSFEATVDQHGLLNLRNDRGQTDATSAQWLSRFATIERIADPRLAVVTQIMCDGGNEQAQRILDALDAHAKEAGL